jgi:hypothetical protein
LAASAPADKPATTTIMREANLRMAHVPGG